MNKFTFSASLRLCAFLLFFAFTVFAQNIPAPKDVIGFTPGDDRKLASWTSIVDYFKKLDAASDRIQFQEIGKTTMGAPFVYATISTPENLKNLEKYKEINAKLADPRLIKSNQKLADDLIRQGKTIVLITCGIHSTEVGSTLSSMLIAEKLVKAEDAETKKILENTIILLVPSLNPDGVDIVKNWYDKTLGTPYEGTTPPELYHKYTGHDNNRDWYAFTQVETQLTVDKIHNVWHPQIVHDIHQQGANGARLFLPPYMQPVEPNVPKEIVEGYTELGSAIAEDLRGKGFAGITTDSTYDAWTPARAYSHYHGGVRILSETASAKIASPTNIKFENLRGDLGYDAKKESPNFRPVWKGGEWRIGDITNYMTTAAFSLMKHASDNRRKWLTRFYAIGKEAVRPRRKGEIWGFKFAGTEFDLKNILQRGGVEIDLTESTNGPLPDFYVNLAQPYGNFAKALLEKQTYPNLKDENGNPIPPYDVTAHTLPLLMDVKVTPVFSVLKKVPPINGLRVCPKTENFSLEIYKSSIASMDEGWTRWVIDDRSSACLRYKYDSLTDSEIKSNGFSSKTIIFPDQSPNQMLNGYAKGTMPDEYTGGIGKDGAANLRKFAEAGGTLVFLNRASDFAIREFNLPVRDVTEGLSRKDFYIPGSILQTEIDTTHPLAQNMPKESIAWFEDSPAFEIQTDPLALVNNFKIIATYPKDPKNILLSGWAFGAEKLAGKAALVEFTIGKGKVILFGFRPQYRGQSTATFPLFFNTIKN
ncbi:MAG: M14 family metallopeptidase [Pyrinomonadaceae bacterium]|nr:M14 family metallopeptidase [Pyrinomonadaceae bacterium]